MTTIECIMNRHCYRGDYLSEAVPREDLQVIMEAGLAAPSGCNKQTTSLIGIDDDETVKNIKAVIHPPIATNAPAFICILSRRIVGYRGMCFAVQDYSAATENMLLAAEALGYKSCWYEGHITDDDRICDRIAAILEVPKDYELVCLLPIGKASSSSEGPEKKPFAERAWFNRFGQCE